jgi:S1-C subfamily serine protease
MKARTWAGSLLSLVFATGCGQKTTSLTETKPATNNVVTTNGESQTNKVVDYADEFVTVADTNWFARVKIEAEKGNAPAQNTLGRFYLDGLNVAQDEMEAVKWYRQAAEQGDAAAQENLGYCYGSGRGVAEDEMEAVKWYRKAAEQGYAKAQSNLGACYSMGTGVAKDNVEAVKWYRKAAEQGYAGGQSGLGTAYLSGEGVAKDEVEAVRWYRKAAEQGDIWGQFRLGQCYGRGEGVAKDEVEAYKWYLLAKAQGGWVASFGGWVASFAQICIESMEEKLTAFQRAEGQKLARDFRPRVANTKHSDFELRAAPLTPQSEVPIANGSGFLITADGYLITNDHVVNAGSMVRVRTSSGLIVAKVVKVDAANDLALLKISNEEGRMKNGETFKPLPISPSRGVKLGGTVATVGFPNIGLQGFAPKLAKGEIASLTGAGDDARYFQISVPVQPGNSGGALVDERGNVVGVVSAKLNAAAALKTSGALPENVNYAIKSSYLLSFLESVPEVSAKLKEPETKERKFEDVVKSAEQAAVLVLVY